MAGLLDSLDPSILGLLGAAKPTEQSSGLLGSVAPRGGLLNVGWRGPAPDEDFLTRIFGKSGDATDPRGPAMMALSIGMLRGGGLAGGLENYYKAYADHEDRTAKRSLNQIGLLKTGLDLQGILDTRTKDRQIAERMAKLNEEERRAQGRSTFATQLDSTPADDFGTPGVGGVPMFGMQGLGPSNRAPAASYIPPSPRTNMPTTQPLTTPLMVGDNAYQGAGQPQPSESLAQYQRLLKQARIYDDAGRPDMALKYLQEANKFAPKYSTEFRQVMDPQTRQLINVQVADDGTIKRVPFGVKPNIKFQDLGNRIEAIDENSTPGGQSWDKSMTPGEVASNRLGWANNANARERLQFEQNTPHFMEVNGQVIAVPKRLPPSGAPTGMVVQGVGGTDLGGSPKLTEAQSKAMAFGSRMVDATRTLDGLDGKASPTNVNRAGYRPDVPWFLGGDAVGSVLETSNRATVPQEAQRIYQAQTNWVTANLRKESGAVIAPDEMANEIRKWFPQPGESAQSIEQKRRARLVQQEAMLAESGPGARQVPGIIERANTQADKKPGGAASADVQALPANPTASNLVKGQRYEVQGKIAEWDGFRFRVVK